MKRAFLVSLMLILACCSITLAEEGMWMPLFLHALNIEEMQDNGLRLSAEDIYDINESALTDAVVIFGRGCTGALISDRGLVITNHHCGLGQIQAHSSLENDYITDGFWAGSTEEELSNPGLSVTFMKRIEDVTSLVNEGVVPEMDERLISQLQYANTGFIKDSVTALSGYKVEIKPFFYGNEFYMFVYEVFNDVRLVGAPPSAIGKFGGDTDNWMWPRHTGDFSLFRIYADKDNHPASYSEDNVPYQPEAHLPISLKGVKVDDFTMVLGYPGSTFQFETSHSLRQLTELSVPAKIRTRTERMNIMQEAMDEDQGVRIKYTSKYARVTNSWKKWIGMLRGLDRLDAINRKIAIENKFQQWADANPDRKLKYGGLISEFDSLYRELERFILVHEYDREVVMAVELFGMISALEDILDEYYQEDGSDNREQTIKMSLAYLDRFFKDYHEAIDRKIFAAMMQRYSEDISSDHQPEMLLKLEKKFKSDYQRMADHIYDKTVFTDRDKMTALVMAMDEKTIKKVLKDPALKLFYQFVGQSIMVDMSYGQLIAKLYDQYKRYVKGLREMQPEKIFYPDANFTMRITYGKVDTYYPKDAVHYLHYTTLKGIIAKDNPEVYDYDVPDKLKELYYDEDYGRYGFNDQMPVCFIASNHTSGGNSGSPVLNADGELIGVNFDRNWEGTMSDYMYDPDQCRNISLDIRFALFIIDKFAGAAHLVDEMTIVD